MKINSFLFSTLLLLWAGTGVHGQGNLPTLMRSVEQNNPVLKAQQAYRQARQLEVRTGLNPPDPLVEYDRLPGRPDGAGVQQEFSITQQLDFPTVYRKRKELARQQMAQAGQQIQIARQQILLDVQKTYVELVYTTKKVTQLQRRLADSRQLVAGVTEKLRVSDATALELNKARIQNLRVEKELRLALSQQRQEYLTLVELNGGAAVALADTAYPLLPTLLPFPLLDSLHEETDPTLAFLRQEVLVDQAQLDLSRALTLPRLQVGYHYQSILGQRYQGLHMGITLPLWEHRHTVDFRKAAIEASRARLAADRNQHYATLARLYEQYQGRLESLEEYRQTLVGLNSTELLETSLRLGQITTLEFILETTYLYDAQDTYLDLERDTYLAAFELLRYQL